MGKIFLSYRRSDSADACGRIYDRLQQAFGRSAIFKDIDAIPGGVDFRQTIFQVLAESAVCIVVIGPDWMGAQPDGRYRIADPADLCRQEVEAALAQGIPLLPLLVRDATMPTTIGAVVPSLAALPDQNARSVRSDPDFHSDMDRVIRDLEQFVPPQSTAEEEVDVSDDEDSAATSRNSGYYADPLTSDRPFVGWSRPVGNYVFRWRPYVIGATLFFGGFIAELVLVALTIDAARRTGAQNPALDLSDWLVAAMTIVGFVLVLMNRRKVPRAWR